MSMPHEPSLAVRVLSVFGLGFLRPAPGTWGSLPPPMLACVLFMLGCRPELTEAGAAWSGGAWLGFNLTIFLVLVFFTLACAAFGDEGEAKFGKKDASQIVADETAGQCIPLLFLPAASMADPITAMITFGLAFFAFRIFDILKLPPAYRLQHIPGGWGVVLDDLVAGIHAMIVVQIITRVIFPLVL